MKVTKYKPIDGGALQGFFDVEIPEWKMEIRSLCYFQSGNKRWVKMPSKKITEDGQEDKWYQYVRFTDNDTKERFSNACIKALDEYILSEHG